MVDADLLVDLCVKHNYTFGSDFSLNGNFDSPNV